MLGVHKKMQDRYAGDVGDFGKFSLLRTIFSGSDNKLVLCGTSILMSHIMVMAGTLTI